MTVFLTIKESHICNVLFPSLSLGTNIYFTKKLITMKQGMLSTLVFLLCLSLSTAASAQKLWDKGIKGEGPIVTKTLELDNFTGFELSLSANVELMKGSTQSVRVEGQQNIIDNIETDVQNGFWKIEFDKNVSNHKDLKIYITLPTVDKIQVSGSGDIIGKSKFTGLDKLRLAISGSGNIDIEAETKTLECKISGSGGIEVAGTSNTQEIAISGSGDVNSYNLITNSCTVKVSGSGDCKVHATESLEVNVVGSGDVYYKGKPNSVRSKVMGSGDVVAAN